MHIKDFFAWAKIKEQINNEETRPNISEREIRWAALGHNIGSEIDGKGDLFARPVLIVSILSNNTCFVLPFTNSDKKGKFIFEFQFNGKTMKARLDQTKVIDTKRLKKKMGRISENKFLEIKEKLKQFLFK